MTEKCYDADEGLEATSLAAWKRCRPLLQSERDRLLALGISSIACERDADRGGYALRAARVLFEDPHFYFSWENPWGEMVDAIILVVRDDFREVVDLAAFELGSARSAVWQGRASMLGQYNLNRATLGQPIVAHETWVEWLSAERTGVCILDAGRARQTQLPSATIAVRTIDFGRRLKAMLTSPPPMIVIARKDLGEGDRQ